MESFPLLRVSFIPILALYMQFVAAVLFNRPFIQFDRVPSK